MRALNENDLDWLEETMNEWDAFEEAPVGCCGKDKMSEKEMEKERDAFMLNINK